MPKPKIADLSSGLVAVKGRAAPPPDTPIRAAELAPVAGRSRQGDIKEAGVTREEIVPLNFRIPASLRRAFKTYAAQHDMKLNELLRVAFEAYRAQQGD
jgi:hypothetical protein